MTKALGANIIAILVIIGFFAVVIIVLIGMVDIQSPEVAKLVGVIVGYLTALLNPVIMSYFKEDVKQPEVINREVRANEIDKP